MVNMYEEFNTYGWVPIAVSQPELPAQGSVEGDIWSALPASKHVLVAHFSQHLLFILLYASSDFIHINSLFDHWVLPCCSRLPYFLFLVTLFALPGYPICSSWLPPHRLESSFTILRTHIPRRSRHSMRSKASLSPPLASITSRPCT